MCIYIYIYIWQARGGECHEIKKYSSHETLPWLIDSVVVFGCPLLSVFIPFLLPFLTLDIPDAEWIFSMAYCSLWSVRNWKYAAYRGTSQVPAVDDDAGKEDTAIRCGMTMDGDWWKATGQTCKQTRQLQIVTYDIITSAGLDQRKTSGNGKWRIKFSSRPTQKVHCGRLGFWPAAAQLSAAKHETVARRGEFVIIRRGSQRSCHICYWSPWRRYVQWSNMRFTVVCCDNRSYMSTSEW